MDANQLTLDLSFLSDTQKVQNALEAEFAENDIYLKYISAVENKGYIAIKSRNLLAAKIEYRKNYLNLEFKSNHDIKFINYKIIPQKNNFSRIVFSTLDEILELAPIIAKIAIEELLVQGERFGCCSRYIECSDAKECIHPDKLFAMCCSYKTNLEQGNIFYGKNKNI